MRRCPVRDCGLRCQDRQFVCARHWLLLPEPLKFDIRAIFNRYLAEEITLGVFLGDGAEIVERHYELESAEGGFVRFTPCARCGCEVLIAHRADRTGKITLEEEDAGGLVVIGGTAVFAAGRGRQYARFVEHVCVATVATRRAVP